MFEKIKLISSDIDGTIAGCSRKINKQDIETIHKLKEKYLFGLASGRPLRDLLEMLNDQQVEDCYDFLIAWNGCEVFDRRSQKKYEYNILKKEELQEIVEFMQRYDCSIHMYYHDQYLSSRNSDRAWFSAFNSKREFVVTEKLTDFYQEDCPGIMFRTKLEDMAKIEMELEAFCKDKNYCAFKTQADLMEFSNKNSNKGFALKKVCELYGVTLQEAMAFGDSSNDNSMLKACFGVCMLNGGIDTKQCAKIITRKSVEENGFSDFVEEHLLNKG